MYSCETMSKGARTKRMFAVRNHSANTIMEKKNKQGERGGLKIQNLVLIPLGHFWLHFRLC